MEFQKDKGNFSFGFGTAKTAGKGNLSGVSGKATKKQKLSAVKTAVKAGSLAAVLLIKHNMKKKK
ncbi:MAG: hypothetical protein IJM19_08475 [Ruminococcus sp.]|nr:hypothetical protein [Ruminococcus sp.]MBR6386250.1 hypothetical protein [Ruminococcus sp.]